MDKRFDVLGSGKLASFKERLQHDLSTHEMRFLIGSFKQTSLIFFAFGIVVFGLSTILDRFLFEPFSLFFYVILFFVALISCVPSFFIRRRWQKNPLTDSKIISGFAYLLLSFRFLSFFLCCAYAYKRFIHDSSSSLSAQQASLIWVTGVFALAWIIYLIPVFIAWFIINRKQAIKLNKFVSKLLMAYLVLLFIVLIALISGFKGAVLLLPTTILFAISCILLFASPILTLYKFKTTSAAIDYENEDEKRKWKGFFVFVMLEELFVVALYVARISLSFLSRR